MTPPAPRYIIKPLAITQDSRLSYAEQDYICLIWQLHKSKGCTASNKFFAKYFNVTKPRVSEIISSLKNKGIIQTTETRKGKNITGRTIIIIDEAIKETLIGVSKKSLTGGIKETPAGGTKETPEEKLNIENNINLLNSPNTLPGKIKKLPQNPPDPEKLKKIVADLGFDILSTAPENEK